MKPKHVEVMHNLRKSIFAHRIPACFDSEKQYSDWLDIEEIAHTTAFRKNVCEDCTNEFKRTMVKNHRCVNIQVVLKE